MNPLSEKQRIQETRYEFPYHYLPQWDGKHYTQTRSLKWGYVYMSYLHFVIRQVNAISFSSLLDVGCGDGRFLFELHQGVAGKRLVGIDYSKQAVAYAKLMSPEVEWVWGNITDPTILREKFDMITLVETLEHIPQDEITQFVGGLHYYSKEGGSLFLTVPSTNVPVEKKHYQHFDLRTLVRVLKPFFEIRDVYYLNKKSVFIRKVFRKILQNKVFILNQKQLLSLMYRYYNRFFLLADERSCTRIALHCKRNANKALRCTRPLGR